MTGTAIAPTALDGPLGVLAPETIGLAMTVLGTLPRIPLAARRATLARGHQS